MKCDVILYSDTTTIGLFWFENWYNEPSVIFINETKCEKNVSEIGEIYQREENLVDQLKNEVCVGDILPPKFFKHTAKFFAIIGDSDFFHKRKIIYTDLIKICSSDMAWIIIHNLETSENEDDKRQAFQCVKILAEECNIGEAYQQLAYYYQEGIGVNKSTEIIPLLMQKASDLGVEDAIEWVKKANNTN